MEIPGEIVTIGPPHAGAPAAGRRRWHMSCRSLRSYGFALLPVRPIRRRRVGLPANSFRNVVAAPAECLGIKEVGLGWDLPVLCFSRTLRAG